jgi:hypothetical protein
MFICSFWTLAQEPKKKANAKINKRKKVTLLQNKYLKKGISPKDSLKPCAAERYKSPDESLSIISVPLKPSFQSSFKTCPYSRHVQPPAFKHIAVLGLTFT